MLILKNAPTEAQKLSAQKLEKKDDNGTMPVRAATHFIDVRRGEHEYGGS